MGFFYCKSLGNGPFKVNRAESGVGSWVGGVDSRPTPNSRVNFYSEGAAASRADFVTTMCGRSF